MPCMSHRGRRPRRQRRPRSTSPCSPPRCARRPSIHRSDPGSAAYRGPAGAGQRPCGLKDYWRTTAGPRTGPPVLAWLNWRAQPRLRVVVMCGSGLRRGGTVGRRAVLRTRTRPCTLSKNQSNTGRARVLHNLWTSLLIGAVRSAFAGTPVCRVAPRAATQPSAEGPCTSRLIIKSRGLMGSCVATSPLLPGAHLGHMIL